MAEQLGPLDWRIPIVTPEGRPTSEFQRRWALQIGNNSQIGSITLGVGAPPATPVPADGAQYADTSTNPYTLYIAGGGTWHLAGSSAADPTATASDVAVNGTATTFMRSDAAPAIQKASDSQYGIVQVDGTTITATDGIISAVGGGGGGGAGWTVLDNYDFATGAPVATREVSVAGMNDLVILGRNLANSSAVQRCIQISVDNGATYYTASGNYADLSGSGTTTNNTAIFAHTTAIGAARDFVVTMTGVSETIGPKWVECVNRKATQLFLASTSAITNIRLLGTSGGVGTPVGTFSSGTLMVLGR